MHLGFVGGEGVLLRPLGRGEGAREVVLAVDALDAVGGIDVLDAGDLVAGGGALAGDDGRVGEEVFPDLLLLHC